MNESCHTDECVISYEWISHVTHLSASCHTNEWVRSHVGMGHVTRMHESWHTYVRDMYIHSMTHIGMSHATQNNEYGVASNSRLLTIIGLFCKRTLQKRRYSAKKIYNFKESTNRSHLICAYTAWRDMHVYAEYRLFYRALLQKRPMIVRSRLFEATPYSYTYIYIWIYKRRAHICLKYVHVSHAHINETYVHVRRAHICLTYVHVHICLIYVHETCTYIHVHVHMHIYLRYTYEKYTYMSHICTGAYAYIHTLHDGTYTYMTCPYVAWRQQRASRAYRERGIRESCHT